MNAELPPFKKERKEGNTTLIHGITPLRWFILIQIPSLPMFGHFKTGKEDNSALNCLRNGSD